MSDVEIADINVANELLLSMAKGVRNEEVYFEVWGHSISS